MQAIFDTFLPPFLYPGPQEQEISILSSLPKGVRFAGIGLLNTLSYIFICWTLNAVTALETRMTNVISYVTCMGLSYVAHRWITFQSRNRMRHELWRFALLHGVNLLLSTGLLTLCAAWGIDRYLALLLSGLFIMASSFLVMQVWVFRDRRPVLG